MVVNIFSRSFSVNALESSTQIHQSKLRWVNEDKEEIKKTNGYKYRHIPFFSSLVLCPPGRTEPSRPLDLVRGVWYHTKVEHLYMANYFYYWTKNTAVLKIYMGFDGRDTPILTFSKSKKYLKIFSPSFNIAIKQNIISWDIYRSVSPMQKHVNCGAFGSVDKITCHIVTCYPNIYSS